MIDCAMFASSHKPGSGIVRNARLWPLLEGGYQGILREVLSKAYIPHNPSQASDEPRRLDPPDRVNGAMNVDGRHLHRSHHDSRERRKPWKGPSIYPALLNSFWLFVFCGGTSLATRH